MPKLQEKPSSLKREHPVLKNMKIMDFFFYFCGSFLPSWIRIRIQIADPDPATQINVDPCGSETLPAASRQSAASTEAHRRDRPSPPGAAARGTASPALGAALRSEQSGHRVTSPLEV
jgi:hypothetical protein